MAGGDVKILGCLSEKKADCRVCVLGYNLIEIDRRRSFDGAMHTPVR